MLTIIPAQGGNHLIQGSVSIKVVRDYTKVVIPAQAAAPPEAEIQCANESVILSCRRP